jgi:hypothetical protein
VPFGDLQIKIILEQEPRLDCGMGMPELSDLFIIETTNHAIIRVIDLNCSG